MQQDKFPYRPSDYTAEIVVQPTDDGHLIYFASYDELLGCDAQGATPEEARRSLEDVFAHYVRKLIANGVPVPPPRRVGAVRVREVVWRELRGELSLVGAA